MSAPRQKTFGRKPSVQPDVSAARVVRRAADDATASSPALPSAPATLEELPPLALRDDVDAELEQWKAVRKARKRSFREPWRTAAIVSTIGFGLSSWLLPESVSTTTDLITGGLAIGSIVAGVRKPRYTPPSATADPT